MFAFVFLVAHIEDEPSSERNLVVVAPDLETAMERAEEFLGEDHVVAPWRDRGFQVIGNHPTGEPWPGDSTE